MYVLAVLMMVKIYQSRHPDINARAHSTFGVLAVLIALGECCSVASSYTVHMYDDGSYTSTQAWLEGRKEKL